MLMDTREMSYFLGIVNYTCFLVMKGNKDSFIKKFRLVSLEIFIDIYFQDALCYWGLISL
jgi:hypothetical protein